VIVSVSLSRTTGKTVYSERLGQDVPELEVIRHAEQSQSTRIEVVGDNPSQNFELLSDQ
jgi:hypothetical protein